MQNWLWYSNTGGSLSDGSLWYLLNGTTPGGTFGVPGPADTASLSANGATGFQTVTGSLGVSVFYVNGNADSNGDPTANFVLTGAISTGAMTDFGDLVVQGTLAMTDSTQSLHLRGGTLRIDGGTLRVFEVDDGIMTGGTFQAVNNAHITLMGAVNANPANGLIGLGLHQTGLIDHSTVDSSAGLISIGQSEPANPSILTVQNGASVKALYTYLGSGSSLYGGTLVITGAGTTYADVGPANSANSSGSITVGGYNTVTDPQTARGSTASLTVSNGATLTEAVSGFIGSLIYSVGTATVSTGGSWTVTNYLRVGNSGTGSLSVMAGSTVKSLGPHVLATSSISFGSNTGSVGTGTVSGAGALLDTGGDRLTIGSSGYGALTVSAGGTVRAGAAYYADTEAALAIGGQAGSTGGLTVTDANSLVQVAGVAVVGGNNTGAGSYAGGSAGLSVLNNGRLNATAMVLYAGGVIAVSSGGIIDLGGTAGAAGALTIEASASLAAYGGAISGPVVDNGLLSNGAGSLTLTGTLSGTGSVSVNGTVAIGNITGGLTYSFAGAHSALALSAESGTSALVGFSQGDTLDFAKQSVSVSVSGGVLTAGGARFSLSGQPAGTHYVTGSDGAGGTLVTALTAANDYNGDGKSDLVLQYSNGSIVIETQSGLSVTGGFLVGNPGSAYHVVGTADYNGDGQPDILIQNTNGTIIDYTMNGTSVSGGFVLTDPGPTWHVRGSGDFNGDGKADILLQNDNGSIVVYDTNGTAITGSAYVGNPGLGWTVEGVADFNGDGQPDILVQNTNGALVDYLMNGSTIVSGNAIGNPGAGWAVAGVGDYNGDGKADVLLHNDNGQDLVLDTNGTTVTGQAYIGNPGANYGGTVAGVDLNADGSTDVVVQGTNSTLVGYTLNSNAAITAGAVLGTPGVGWRAIGDNPIQYIDGTGSATSLAATPGLDQFDFTSFMGGAHTIAGFDAAQDSVALSAATFGSYAAVQANEVAYQGGTFIALTPGSAGAALVIQGVTPGQLSASNFEFR